MVACGEDFSLALSRSGNVYSTGAGDFGIHGCGDALDELKDRWAFNHIGAGDSGFFANIEIKQLQVGEHHAGGIDS